MIVRTAVLLAASLFAGTAAAANPPILVTSGVDNGTDGAKTTLREALRIAARKPGPDRVVIDPSIYSIALEGSIEVADRDPVTIDADPDDDGVGRLYAYVRVQQPFFEVVAGTRLTVIGALFEHGSTVGKMGNAGEPGVWGTGGASGVDHSELGDNKVSLPGGDGTDGTPGLAGGPGGKGQPAAAYIVNHGRLTLVRTSFGKFFARGGNGGLGGGGGRGGNGGYGGNGGNAKLHQTDSIDVTVKSGGAGGNGGNGGQGGRGGAGGAGGDVAGAIFNDKGATLELVDVSFGGRSTYFGYRVNGGEAVGGSGSRGGSGGDGGNAGGGGIGGRGGVKGLLSADWEKVPRGTFGLYDGGTYDPCLDSQYHPCGFTTYTLGGRGGAGARGGNAGPAGPSATGGDAAGAVLNYGAVGGSAAISVLYTAKGGAGGDPMGFHAFGGTVGTGGLGGLHKAGKYFLLEFIGDRFIVRYAGELPTAANGAAGKAGADAAVAAKGADGKGVGGILTKGSGASEAATVAPAIAFVHDLGRTKDADGKPFLSFNVIRLGDTGAGVRVRWKLRAGTTGRPVTAADFAAGVLPSGTVTLPAVPASVVTDEKNAVRVDLPLTAKALVPAGKTYTVELLPLPAASKTILGTDSVGGAL